MASKRFLFTALALSVVLAIAFSFTPHHRLRYRTWYLERVEGSSLRHQLGFDTGYFNLHVDTDRYEWGITAVESGGPFADAGVLSGDVPVIALVPGHDGGEHRRYLWYHGVHDARGTFYSFLGENRGDTATFGVVAGSASKDWSDSDVRMITVAIPDE